MSTRWTQIHEMYLNAVGHNSHAARGAWNIITAAYREVGARETVRELFQPAAVQATTASQDYIEIDTDVYAIISVLDITTARQLDRESSWARRMDFCEPGEGKPPEGELSHFFPWAKRLYLRQTPPDERDLQISYRFHPPLLTDADLELYPATPPQYDDAILHLAIHKADTLHPTEHSAKRNALAEAERILGVVREQRAEEKNAMRKSHLQLRGYQFS